MAPTEDDLLKEAIAGTEAEIFNEATGKAAPSDEGGPGDRSVEEMGTGLEGQLEPDEPEAAEAGDGGEAEAAGEGDGEQPKPGEQGHDPKTGQFLPKDGEKPAAKAADDKPVDPKARVPLGELITERKQRQALEAQLQTERDGRKADADKSKSEFEKLNSRIDQLLAQPRQQQQPQPVPQPAADKPDIFDNPEAFVANMRAELSKDISGRYLEADLKRTHKAHGENFEKAYSALTSLDKNDPGARATVQKIWNSPTPGDDLMDWHKQQETLRVVGSDPTAYAEKIRAEEREKLAKDPEFRKQLLANLQAEARGGSAAPAQDGAPRVAFRMPKSLNGAAGGQSPGGNSAAALDGSDRGVFDAAFAPD